MQVRQHTEMNPAVTGAAKVGHQQLNLMMDACAKKLGTKSKREKPRVELGQPEGSPVFFQQPLPSSSARLSETLLRHYFSEFPRPNPQS